MIQHIIETAIAFDAEMIILDHLQGFVSGDLNNSDTATALAREANLIVDKTNAAVVFTAHISKASIGAQNILDGFTSGSLAFENAARQVVGIIPLPDEDAKKFGLEPIKEQFALIGVAKNSYGPSQQNGYLRKVHVPDFHTITVEPFTPTAPAMPLTTSERIMKAVLDHIRDHPGTSPNKLDTLAGKNGQFKASRKDVREATQGLEELDLVKLVAVTKQQRVDLGLPHQIKKVYAHVER